MSDENAKQRLEADEMLSEAIRRLAHARRVGGKYRQDEADAKDEVMEALSNVDFNGALEVVDKTGLPLVHVNESYRQGSVDLARLAAEHPDINLDDYRKPKTVSVTVRISEQLDSQVLKKVPTQTDLAQLRDWGTPELPW